MSKNEINPLEDWASEELSEAELDALTGGRTSAFGIVDPNIFAANTTIMKKHDDMFSSYDGAKGTTLGQLDINIKPMDFSPLFP